MMAARAQSGSPATGVPAAEAAGTPDSLPLTKSQ